mgnify:CR=1 FL=1
MSKKRAKSKEDSNMGRFQRANVIRPIADHEGHVAERSQDLRISGGLPF